jgi:hypothetical protein
MKCIDKYYYLPHDRILCDNQSNENYLKEIKAFDYYPDFWNRYVVENEVFVERGLCTNKKFIILSQHLQIVKYSPLANRNQNCV